MPSDERQWYGWQTLAADAVTLAVFDVGTAVEQDGVAAAGLGGFVLASPGIHLAHNRVGPGIVSLSGHGLLPLGGFVVSRAVLSQARSMGDKTKTIIGVTLGGAAAAAIDAVWLAWENPPVNEVQVYVGWGEVGVSGAF